MNDAACERIDPVSLAYLLDPRPKRSIDALRVALVMLAGGGHIVVDATPGGDSFVRVQRAPAPATPEHIVAVYRVLRDAASGGRLSRASARQALARAFGWRFQRYGKTTLSDALVARDLVRVDMTRLLGLFASRRTRRTPKGDALATRVARQVADLDALPQLVDTDPRRAWNLARAAGPLLLLSAKARTALPRLRGRATAALHGGAFALVEEPEAEWLDLFDSAELVMTLEFDGLLDAMEPIGEFGSDGGSGSSDGDGGGDGGGGGD